MRNLFLPITVVIIVNNRQVIPTQIEQTQHKCAIMVLDSHFHLLN